MSDKTSDDKVDSIVCPAAHIVTIDNAIWWWIANRRRCLIGVSASGGRQRKRHRQLVRQQCSGLVSLCHEHQQSKTQRIYFHEARRKNSSASGRGRSIPGQRPPLHLAAHLGWHRLAALLRQGCAGMLVSQPSTRPGRPHPDDRAGMMAVRAAPRASGTRLQTHGKTARRRRMGGSFARHIHVHYRGIPRIHPCHITELRPRWQASRRCP